MPSKYSGSHTGTQKKIADEVTGRDVIVSEGNQSFDGTQVTDTFIQDNSEVKVLSTSILVYNNSGSQQTFNVNVAVNGTQQTLKSISVDNNDFLDFKLEYPVTGDVYIAGVTASLDYKFMFDIVDNR